MTITGQSTLDKKDIDQMVRDAEAHAEEDRQRREEAEIRNNADSLVYQTEKVLREQGDNVSAEEKAAVEQPLAREAHAAERLFELALDIHANEANDLALLDANGWVLCDPRRSAADPEAYRCVIETTTMRRPPPVSWAQTPRTSRTPTFTSSSWIIADFSSARMYE